MRKTCARVLLLPAFLLGSAPPPINRPVEDTVGLLSPSDREAVARALVQLRRETGAQMAVLIVGTTRGAPIEDYAMRAAEAWKDGAAGRDNGLLLVLAAHDRRQRLDVGQGLEAYLPDDAVRTLLEAQGPLLRQWNYRGTLLGVPMAAIALSMQSSQRPTAHFLLAFASFTLMFFVATRVSLRSSYRWGPFVGSAPARGSRYTPIPVSGVRRSRRRRVPRAAPRASRQRERARRFVDE